MTNPTMTQPWTDDEQVKLIAFNVATQYLLDKSAGKATPLTQLIEAKLTEVRDAWATDRAALVQRVAELERVAKELYQQLDARQRCEECGGSGAIPWIDYAEDDVSMEPCTCWSDAEDVITKYAAEFGDESETENE